MRLTPEVNWLRRRSGTRISTLLLLGAVLACLFLSACGQEAGDPELTKRTYVELVDWHISGFWVINCPVAWVRIANYNTVPIKDVTFDFYTFDYEGKQLNKSTYTITDSQGGPYVIQPGAVRNAIELYLGNVDLNSERLTIQLDHVSHG